MLIRKLFLAPAGLLLVLFLAGCVTSSVGPPTAGGFLAQGRLNARPGPTATPFAPLAASFVWRQEQELFDIEMWGPLGIGRTRMFGTEESVEWVDARGERRVSNDPQALMRSQLCLLYTSPSPRDRG